MPNTKSYRFATMLVVALTAHVGRLSAQTHYDFNVSYFGGAPGCAWPAYICVNATSLAFGSANPLATTLMPGDDFAWDIKAQNGAYWSVLAAGNPYAWMAFPTVEGGERRGDFSLALSLGGITQLTYAEVGAVNCWAHVGTNWVNLPAGMQFDEMKLSYTLNNAFDGCNWGDPDITGRTVIGTTPTSLLPYFGPPEAGSIPWSSPALQMIDFVGGSEAGQLQSVTPEPGTMALMATGLVGIAGASIRRRALRNEQC